jgi:glycosyltransferase involved in cell wall biosynthesis
MINVLSVLHYPVYGGPHNRNVNVAVLLEREDVNTTLVLPSEAREAERRVQAAGGKTLLIPLSRLRKTLKPSDHIYFLRSFMNNVHELREIIRDRNIDVVVINGLVNPHAAIAARREGVPVVWQILDSFPPPFVRNLFRPILQRYADVIMCTGAEVAKQHFVSKSIGKPLVLFYPPVDLTKFSPNLEMRKKVREELGISDGDFVVGNVANVNPMKGHMTFVKAAALVKRALPNSRFVILGQTYPNHAEYARRLNEEAVRLGLEPGSDFRVLDPGSRVAELAQAFDVYWLTSEPRSEGISTAAEEAMSLGLPVISTDVGSMREIVRDGDTGFIVAPRDIDAIARHTIELATDSAFRILLGENAREFAANHFGAERCAAQHLLAYRAALGCLRGIGG